ncbi:MAG: ERCC4 domain-containing protein [Candidatus Aenigmarchaeota archaeon]|nr:ERCC4 domain-containing protein [Candidatus Aenigmarchaeota archaeon]
MEKQLTLSNNIVFVDYREEKIANLLEKMGCKIVRMNLPIGDFVVNDVGIERKSFEDFISSIIDGRIFEQANSLSSAFKKPIIIVEGFGVVERIHENSFYATLAYIVSKSNVTIFRTKNEEETAKLIYWIARKEFENSGNVGFKIKEKKVSVQNIQERILAAFPGISTVLSKRILKKFGSLKKFFNASEKELMEVDGIGEKTAKRIRKIIEEEYKGD